MKEPDLKDLVEWHAVPLGAPLQHLPPISAATNLELRRSSDQGRGVFLNRDCPQGSILFIERAFSLGRDTIELCIATAMALEKNKTVSPSSCRRYFALEGGCRHVPEADSLDWWLKGEALGGAGSMASDDIPTINGRNCLTMTTTDEIDGMQEETFNAVFFVAALMNHSCVPTASLRFVGDAVVVRAARDMVAGEELTNTYIPTYLCLPARQAELESYHFVCSCIRCQAESVVPKALQPPVVAPLGGSEKTAEQILCAAIVAERYVIANAPQEVLDNIEAAGLRLRGCFLCPNFQALAHRLGQLGMGSPEASFVAELMQEAAAAALPNSPTHSFCCSCALGAIGSQGQAYQGALDIIAARAFITHNACYGGGRAFWFHRLKGSSCAPHALASQNMSALNAPNMLCCRSQNQGVLIEISTFWASGSNSLEVFASDVELRIASPDGKTMSIPCPGQDSSFKYNRFSRCLKVFWPVLERPAALNKSAVESAFSA